MKRMSCGRKRLYPFEQSIRNTRTYYTELYIILTTRLSRENGKRIMKFDRIPLLLSLLFPAVRPLLAQTAGPPLPMKTAPETPIHGTSSQVQRARSQRPAPPERSRKFVEIRDHQLYRGNIALRNVGVNIPDLFERYLNGDAAGANKTLADAHPIGVRLARCWGTTWGPDNFGLFQTDRTRWFRAFDQMLGAADDQGIAIVPSLLFNIHMLTDYVRRTQDKTETLAEYLTLGSLSNGLAVDYVTTVVTRYRNDPRVLFWEIGNEYNLEADIPSDNKAGRNAPAVTSAQVRAFLTQIATLIHRLDKHHLVTSGNADMRASSWHLRDSVQKFAGAVGNATFAPDWTPDTFAQYTEMLRYLNPPPLDIISVHQYSQEGQVPLFLVANNPDNVTNNYLLPWTSLAALDIGQPLFLGEFGQKYVVDGKEQAAPWDTDTLKRLVNGDAPVSALWAWEFTNGSADQEALSTSPTRTPEMTKLIGSANNAIANALLTSNIGK